MKGILYQENSLGRLVNHNTPHLLLRTDGTFTDPVTGEKLGFDNRKMGSGEGAQVYGWGVYVAVDDLRKYGNLHHRNIRFKEEIFDCSFIKYGQITNIPLRATRDEIRQYKLALTAGNIASHFDLYDCTEKDVKKHIKDLIEIIEAKISILETDNSKKPSISIQKDINSNKQRLDDYNYLLKHIKVVGVRHHYDVEIPDYDGKNYLPWQKAPNKQQFDMISTVLTPTQANKIKKSWNGEDIYRYLVEIFKTPEKASKTLNKVGFIGVHYYGHTDGECYVIFDDKDAKIVRHELYGLQGIKKLSGTKNVQMQDKEFEIVLKAREIILQYYRDYNLIDDKVLPFLGLFNCYKDLVELYKNQPIITPKDGKAIALQQYSTPCPIAYLMSEFIKGNSEFHITDKNDKFPKTYYEPTAGNGMLTIALPHTRTLVNELDEVRVNNLKKFNFVYNYQSGIRQNNAAEWKPNGYFDGVIMNPPFGSLKKSEYYTRKGVIDNHNVEYTFERLDYKIAINSLDCMRDDGKAAIIIGGKLAAKTNNDYKTTYWKNGKLFGQYRDFIAYLHRQYNIVDIIYINGDLYRKQGTTFPIVLILIDGRTEWNSDSKHAWHNYDKQLDRQINSFDELFYRISKHIKNQESELLNTELKLIKK